MKILVIGATGTIGSAVADALAGTHEVVRASRSTGLDIDDLASVEAALATPYDAVVSCATGTPARWQALFGPLDRLDEAQLDALFAGVRAQLRGGVPYARLYSRLNCAGRRGSRASRPRRRRRPGDRRRGPPCEARHAARDNPQPELGRSTTDSGPGCACRSAIARRPSIACSLRQRLRDPMARTRDRG